MATTSACHLDENDVYRQLDEYRWDQDDEFQGGLSAILGPNTLPNQVNELTLRAKCFYFSRKMSIPISFDGFKSYLLSKTTSMGHSNLNELCSHSQSTLYRDDLCIESPGQSSPNHQADILSLQTASERTAPYPSSFAEIIELIASGSPIPGIREIPSTTVPEQASIPTASRRKKPWEHSSLNEQMDDGTYDN